MIVKLKLMGMLKNKIGKEELELPDNADILTALQELDIAPESVQVFTVNGKLIREQSHLLHDEDELTILPPVGGG